MHLITPLFHFMSRYIDTKYDTLDTIEGQDACDHFHSADSCPDTQYDTLDTVNAVETLEALPAAFDCGCWLIGALLTEQL